MQCHGRGGEYGCPAWRRWPRKIAWEITAMFVPSLYIVDALCAIVGPER